MLEMVAQRGCGVLILGDIQKLSGHDAEQPALVDLCLSRHVRLDDFQLFCDSEKATMSLTGRRLSKNSVEKIKIALSFSRDCFQGLKSLYPEEKNQ